MTLLHTGAAPFNPAATSIGAPGSHRSSRCHFKNGQRVAVLRALTAARLYLNGEVSTLEAAAASCGSNSIYIAAVITVIKAEDSAVLMNVLAGVVPLLAAARQLKHVAQLVDSYRKAGDADLATYGKTIGVGDIWDRVVNPAL